MERLLAASGDGLAQLPLANRSAATSGADAGATAAPGGIKFGAETSGRLADLLDTAIAAEQMERISDWIVECDNGGDLLARVSTMRANGSSGS